MEPSNATTDQESAAANLSNPPMSEPKIKFPKCRHIIVALGFFGFINLYALRVNLSVAIVTMVDTEYLRGIDDADAANGTVPQYAPGDVCEVDAPDPNTTLHSANDTKSGPFKWDSKKQGSVIASFFYGYLVTQVPGGMLAQRYGGKWPLLIGIGMTAILTLLTPVLSIYGDYPVLIGVRVLEGIFEAVAYPSMHSMLSRWAPPMERSKMATTVYAGGMMGVVIAMPVSGVLCDVFGWESVFYFFGIVGIVWSILWFFLVFNSPAEHPRITQEERDYIESHVGKRSQEQKANERTPWLKIFTSVRFGALAMAHVCNNFGYYTLMNCLPLYFKYILHFDIKSNGVLSGAPYFVMWFSITFSGVAADKMRQKISTTVVRKIAIIIGFILPAIFLVITGYVGCDAAVAVALIIAAVGASGVAFSGWSVNHLDLAPPYAGTMMGITNTLATIPGFIGPSVVGAITYKNQTVSAWRTVFYITAAIYTFGTLFYIVLGSGELQPWAQPKKFVEMTELTADEKKKQVDNDDDDDGKKQSDKV